MPLYFQRPENALKRANEFIDVGEKQWALDALYDVIKSRKHRTWQKIHEPIMSKYLELCVELKKSHVAKEGLFQYRNICQQVNIKSLEDVVRGYLSLAEEKTEAAKAESHQVVVDVDDLDQVETPENLLLSAVSSEDTQDRTDRVVLTPWVKFLWESYRQCLELLRNNSRVERLYHDIAQQAFKFCLKYNRKTEFRKLCDNLRAHLGHIHKHQNQQTSVNINNPESQAMHLETRLVQLESAIHMELWMEAYKAIEDIHGLMNLSKKASNPRLMANYYQKLSLVFWKSNNYLFHAAALVRLFYLSREQKKNITPDEILRMAGRVVLATLAIPMPPNRIEIDRLVETDENVIDKNHKLLSTLLGLSNPPSRASLIKDIARFGIIQCAPVPVQDLYRWLEKEFHPLKLCARVQQSFDFFIKWEEFPELKQYISSIQDITIVRLIFQISQVYQTIRFSRILELVPFVQSYDLEYIIVEVSRRNDLQVRIDHKKECFHFGSELNVSQKEEIAEGPHLQSMPSEQMRNQLVFMHSTLNKAVNFIQPGEMKKGRKELSKDIVKAYMLTSSKDHVRILNRQQIIEERKEMLENLNFKKEAEERKSVEDTQLKLREAEKERMTKETEERSKQRFLREQTELKRKVVMEKIEQMKKTEIGSRIFNGMDEGELEKLDPDDLLNRQVEQLDRDKKELQTKLRNQERKIDHVERAKRIEEKNLLQAEYEEFKIRDYEFWQEYEKGRIKAIVEERALAVQYRDRLMRLKDDTDKFREQLKTARSSIYQEKLSEFKKVLDAERKKCLTERRQKRKEERRAAWLKEQEEKRQRLIEEKLKMERDEEFARLKEIEAKKAAKDKEIEERLKREQDTAALKRSEEGPVGFLRKDLDKPAPHKSFTNWREREQEKRQSWAPKEKSDKDHETADIESKDWRKRSEELKKIDDREKGTDDWRKLRTDKPKEEEKSLKKITEISSPYQRVKETDETRKLDDSDRASDWRKREKPKDDRPWRRDDKSSYQRNSENDPRDWRTLRSEVKDAIPDSGSDWRSASKKMDEKKDTQRFGERDYAVNLSKERGSGFPSSRFKDIVSSKDHSVDDRDKYSKDGDRFTKFKNEDSSERRDKYPARGGFRTDRPVSSRFRDGSDRREKESSWRKQDENILESGSWRDKEKSNKGDGKRIPKDEGIKKDKFTDEDGFVKVRK